MNTHIKDIKNLLMSLQKEDIVYSIPIPNVMKFKVNGDIELSKAIRAELKRLGFRGGALAGFDRVHYLFTYYKDRGVQITNSDNPTHYENHSGIETTLEELKLMEKENEERTT